MGGTYNTVVRLVRVVTILVMSQYSISPLSEDVDEGLLWLLQDVATDLQQESRVRFF